jgi:hypothetical protein
MLSTSEALVIKQTTAIETKVTTLITITTKIIIIKSSNYHMQSITILMIMAATVMTIITTVTTIVVILEMTMEFAKIREAGEVEMTNFQIIKTAEAIIAKMITCIIPLQMITETKEMKESAT